MSSVISIELNGELKRQCSGGMLGTEVRDEYGLVMEMGRHALRVGVGCTAWVHRYGEQILETSVS